MTMTLELKGLDKQTIAQLSTKAKRLGVTPERYVKRLVVEDLQMDELARTRTLSELLGHGHEVDEGELDRLVERARNRHHQRVIRKR
jgi:hypothetical protein